MNTKTQLSSWSKGFLEAAVLAAVTAVPLVVNYEGFRAFELPKAALVWTFALLAAAVGVIALVEGGEATGVAARAALRQGVVRAALAVIGIEGLATVFSVVPSVSFFGSPERAEGWLSLIACATLFAATVAVGRVPERRRRIVGALIAGSVPVAVYALTQAAQLEVVPGKVEAALRVFGTLSNPIFLGAYLMLLVPLTLWRFGAALTGGRPIVAGWYALVTLLQVSALVLSESRGPLVGLLAGLVILGLGWAAAAGRRNAVIWAVGVGAALAVFLGLLAMPNTPLAGLRQAPIIGRIAQIGDTQSGSQAVRLGIWGAVVRTMAAPADPNAGQRPLNSSVDLKRGRVAKWLVGHGPEMQRYVMLPYGNTYMGGRTQADRLVDRAHDVPYDVLLTAGLPGLAARLWLWAAWLAACVVLLGLAGRRRERTVLGALLAVGALSGVAAALIAPAMAGPVAALGLAVGLGLYVLWAGWRRLASRPVDGLALALLASGTAMVVEAAFGIETVVTQLIVWVLAGLVVARALGDVEEPVLAAATASRRSAPRRTTTDGGGTSAGTPARDAAGTEVRVGMRWSPGGAGLGLIGAIAMSVVTYDLLLPGVTTALRDTYPVLGLLLVMAFVAMLVAVVDAHESAGAYVLFALTATALWFFLRILIVVAGQPSAADPTAVPTSLLWVCLVLWLVFLVLGAGAFLRTTAPKSAPFWAGAAGITYPVLGIIAVSVMMLIGIRPVQGDLVYQAAYDNYQVALQGDNEPMFKVAETRFSRAVELQPRDDIMFLKWSELYAQLGQLIGQSLSQPGQAENMATAFNTAQNLLGRAEAINPAMVYHVFNRGHVQLLAAQIMSTDPKLAPNVENIAQNAELALQQAFDTLTYDPQVANELAMTKLLQPSKSAEGLALLEYSRDSLDDKNAVTYQLLAEAYRQAGDTAKADEAIQRASELGAADDPGVLLRLGDEARQAGDFMTARSKYEQAVKLLGARVDWKILFNLGLLYRDSGDPQLATQALSDAMKLAPEDAQDTIQQALMDVLKANSPPDELSQPRPEPARATAPATTP
ncbi:MAG: tetratricopeptide repeat protein [Ardenticatenales bacterium]